MDSKLREALDEWHRQIEKLREAEEKALFLEASEKPLYSKLFLSASGKTVAEKEALAYSNSDWESFQAGMVRARSNYNHERRILELRQKEYESNYLSLKVDSEAIRKAF